MHHLLGQFCALLTAILWGYALVLFKLGGERIQPIALNLYKNAVGLVLLAATLGLLLATGLDSLEPVRQRSLAELGLLVASGFIGIALADTIFFYSLNLIGVGLFSIVDCTYCPFAILFSWLLLGERLNSFHYLGAVLIVLGVLTASPHTIPVERTRRQIIGGMLLGAVSVGLMALGIVMIKPVLEQMPIIWATTLRLAAGSVFLAAFALRSRDWRRHWIAFRPTRSWKHVLPASVLGTYLCLILWIAGFKYTYASVAAVLNQTSVVFASVLAAVILKERFGARQIAALVTALTGVVIVTFSEKLRELTGF